jgi:hypothetical protein
MEGEIAERRGVQDSPQLWENWPGEANRLPNRILNLSENQVAWTNLIPSRMEASAAKPRKLSAV